MILEEPPAPKDVPKKQMQLTDEEALMHTTGNSDAHPERQDAWAENDFEMSPSSPTLLLRNIEKQVFKGEWDYKWDLMTSSARFVQYLLVY